MNHISNRKGTAVKRPSFLVLGLGLECICQVLQRAGHSRVVWPINYLLIRKGAAVKRLSFLVLGLGLECICQVLQRAGHSRVVWPMN